MNAFHLPSRYHHHFGMSRQVQVVVVSESIRIDGCQHNYINSNNGGRSGQKESWKEMDSKPKAKDADDLLGSDAQAQPKRKRKSPAVPWKKPKDMPKRPLSAYNLFFKDERERILGTVGKNASPEGNQQPKESTADQTSPDPAGVSEGKPVKKKRRRRRVSLGIGFANLAKSIATKWNELDPESKAPYLDIATREKAKYDEAVALWRIHQKRVQKDPPKDKKEPKKDNKLEAALSVASVASVPSDKSMLSLEPVEAETYPSTWFKSSLASESDHSETTKMPAVPEYINAINDESSRTAASDLTTHFHARRRHPDLSGTSVFNSEASASTSVFRSGPLDETSIPGSPGVAIMDGLPFSTDASPSESPGNAFHGHSRLANDMANIQRELEDLRRTRASMFGITHSPPIPPVSFPTFEGVSSQSSMPLALAPPPVLRPATYDPWGHLSYHNRAPPPPPGHVPHPYYDRRYFHIPATHAAPERRIHPSQSSASLPGAIPRIAREDDAVVDTSLHSLSQRLDDDTIDFLTSAFFNRGPT